MGNVFVGSMCAIGVFLWSYKVYDLARRCCGNYRLRFRYRCCTISHARSRRKRNQFYIHIVFAAVFFITLTYFAIGLFRKTHPAIAPTHMKLVRNKVYAVCGYTIIAAITLIAVLRFVPADSPIQSLSPVFWLESIASIAFGISWFVKGEAILKGGH
jgi:hypothetical protein